MLLFIFFFFILLVNLNNEMKAITVFLKNIYTRKIRGEKKGYQDSFIEIFGCNQYKTHLTNSLAVF